MKVNELKEDVETIINALHILYSSSLWQEKEKNYEDGLRAINHIEKEMEIHNESE